MRFFSILAITAVLGLTIALSGCSKPATDETKAVEPAKTGGSANSAAPEKPQ